MITILATITLVFAVMAFAFSVYNFIHIKAMQLSTHKVQFVPAEPTPDVPLDEMGFETITPELSMKFDNDDISFDPLFDDDAEVYRPEALRQKAKEA